MKSRTPSVSLFVSFLTLFLGLAGPALAQTWTLAPGTASVEAGDTVTLTISGLSTTEGPQSFAISTNGASYLSGPAGATQAMYVVGGVTSYSSTITFDMAGVMPGGPIRVRVSDGTSTLSSLITITNPVVTFTPAAPTINYGQTMGVTLTRNVANAPLQLWMVSDDLSIFGVGTNRSGINYDSAVLVTFDQDELAKTIRLSGLSYVGGTAHLWGELGDYATQELVTVAMATAPTSPMFVNVIAGDTAMLTSSGLPITTNYPPTVIYNSPIEDPRVSVPSNVTQQLEASGNRYKSTASAVIAGVYRMTNMNPDPIPVHLLYTMHPTFGVYATSETFVGVLDPLLTFENQPIGVSIGDTVQIRVVRPGLEANASLPFTLTSSDPSILTLSTTLDELGSGTTSIQFGTFENDKILYGHGRGLTEGVLATDITVSAQVGSYVTNISVHVTRNGILSLTPVSPFMSAGDSLQMLVSRSTTNRLSALEVLLQTDVAGIATVPASVMIPAGATSATFLVSGKAPGSCVLNASAQGCETNANSSRTVTIGDPHLGFQPSPFTNLDVGVVGYVTLARQYNEVGAPLTVSLLSQNPDIFTTTAATSTFQATISDIQLGLQGVSSGTGVLTVCAGSYCTNFTIVVKPAALTLSSAAIVAGDTAAITVSRPCSASSSDLLVHLQSLDSSALAVPDTVTIPAGQCQAVFTATGVSPSAGVTVQAVADGYQPGSISVAVSSPNLSFEPTEVTNVVGDVTTFVITRPSSDAGAALAVTMQSAAPDVFTFSSSTFTIPAGYVSTLVTLQGVSVGSGIAQARVGTYVTNLSVQVTNPHLSFSPNPVTTTVGDSRTAIISRPSIEAGAALTVSLTPSDPSLFSAGAGSLTFAVDASSASLTLSGLSPGTGLLHVASGSYVTDLTVVVESPTLTFSPDPASTVVGDTKNISISRPLSEAGGSLTMSITPSDTSLFRASLASATMAQSETLVDVTLTGVAAGTGTLRIVTGAYSTNLVVVVSNPNLTFAPNPLSVVLGDLAHVTITRQSSEVGSSLPIALESSDSSIFRTSTNNLTIQQGEYSCELEVIAVSPGTGVLQIVSSTYSSNITVVVLPPNLTVTPNPIPVAMGDASDIAISRPSTESGAELPVTFSSSDPSIFRPTTNAATIWKDTCSISLSLLGISQGTGTLQVSSATFSSNITVVVGPPTLRFSPDPASNVVGGVRRVNVMRLGTQVRGAVTVTLTSSDPNTFTVNTNAYTLQAGEVSFEVVLTGAAMGTGALHAAAGIYSTNLPVIIGQPTVSITPAPITNLVGETRTITFTRLSTEGGAVLPISLASSDPGVFRLSTNVVLIGADSFATNIEMTGLSSGTGILQVVISTFTNRIPVTVNNPVLTFSPLPLSVNAGQSRAVTLTRDAASTTLELLFASSDGQSVGVGTNIFSINYGTAVALKFEPFELSKIVWISGLSFGDSSATLTAQAGNYQTSTVVTVNGPGDPVVPMTLSVIAGDTAVLSAGNLPITTNNAPIVVTYELPEYENRLTIPVLEEQSLSASPDMYLSSIGAAIAGIKRADVVQPNPIPLRMIFFAGEPPAPYYTNETYVSVLDPTFTFLPAAPVVQVGDTIPLTVVRPPFESGASLPFTLESSDPGVLGLGTTSDKAVATNLSLVFNAVSSSGSVRATEYPVYVTARALSGSVTSQTVYVTARVGDYSTNIPIRVTRNGLLSLSLVSPSVIAGDAMVLSVSKSGPANASPFEVTLNIGCSGTIEAPTSVVIPAGATSATFNVAGLMPGSCTLIATAAGCETNANSTQIITVTEPCLTFSADPYTNLTVGSVSDVKAIRPYNEVGGTLAVNVLSMNPELFEPLSSTGSFAVGSSMAPIGLHALAGGTGTLSVCVGSYCTTLTVVVQSATLTIGTAAVVAGDTASLTLSRSCNAIVGDLVVRLQSLDSSALTVPSTVTIPAGRCETVFTVTGVAPSAGVTIQAMADGYAPGSASVAVANPTLTFTPMVITNIAGNITTFAVSRPAGEEGASLTISAQSLAANLFAFTPDTITIAAGDVSALVSVRGISTGNASGELRVGTYVTNVAVIIGNPTLSFAPSPITVTVGDRQPVSLTRPSTEAAAVLFISLSPSDPNLFGTDFAVGAIPADVSAVDLSVTGFSPGTGVLHVTTGSYETNLTVIVRRPTVTFTPDPASTVVGDTRVVTLQRPLTEAGSVLTVALTPSDTALFRASASTASFPTNFTGVDITLTGVGLGTGTLSVTAGTYTTNLTVVIGNPSLSISPNPAPVVMGDLSDLTITRQSTEVGASLAITLASSDSGIFRPNTNALLIAAGQYSAGVSLLGVAPGTGTLQVTAATFTSNVTVVVSAPTLSFTPTSASNVVGSTRQVTVQRQATHARAPLTVTLTPADATLFGVSTGSVTMATDQSSFDFVLAGVGVGTSRLIAAAGPYYSTNLSVFIGLPTLTVTPNPITNQIGETRSVTFTRPSTEGGASLPIEVVSSDPGIFSVSTNIVIMNADAFATNVMLSGVSIGTGTLQVVSSALTNRIPVTIVNPSLTFSPLPLSLTSGASRAVTLTRGSANTELSMVLVSDDRNVLGIGTNGLGIDYSTVLNITFARYETSKTIWMYGLTFDDSFAVLTAYAGSYQTSAVVTVYGPGAPVVPFNLSVIAGNSVWLYAENLPITTNNWPIRMTYELPEYETRLLGPVFEEQEFTDSKTLYKSYIRGSFAGLKRQDSVEPNPIPIRMEFYANPDLGPYSSAVTYMTILDPTFSFLPEQPVVTVGDTMLLTVTRPPLEACATLPFTLESSDPAVLDLSTNASGSGASASLSLMFGLTVSTGAQYATYFPVYVSARALTASQTSAVVTVTARVGDYTTNLPVRVTRNGLLKLSPASPSVIAGDSIAMTVSKSGPSNDTPFNITLNLGCDDVYRAPTNVVIAAGATSAVFNVSGIMPGSCRLIATAVGCETNPNSSCTVTVTDPALTFSAAPYTNLTVGNVGDVKVIRPYNQAGDSLTVNVLSLNPDVVQASNSTATIAAGDSMAPIELQGMSGGTGVLSVCAGSYCTNLTVIVPSAALTLSSGSVAAGDTVSITVSRPCTSIANDLVVRLQSLDTSALTVPTTVTIPAGRCDAVFTATGVTPAPSVSVQAMADGYALGTASISVGSPTLIFTPLVVTNVAGDATTFAISRPAGQNGATLTITARSLATTIFTFESTTVTIPAGDVSAIATVKGVSVGSASAEMRVGTYVTNISVVVGSPTLSFSPYPMTVTVGDRLPVALSRPSTEAGAELILSFSSSDPNLFGTDFVAGSIPADVSVVDVSLSGFSPGTGVLHVSTGTYETNLTVIVRPPTVAFSPNPASTVVGDTCAVTLSRPLTEAGAILTLGLTPSDASLFRPSVDNVSLASNETATTITLTGVGSGTGVLYVTAGTYATNLTVVIGRPHVGVSPSPVAAVMGDLSDITITRQSTEVGASLTMAVASSDTGIFRPSTNSIVVAEGQYSAGLALTGVSPGTGTLQITTAAFTTNVTVVVAPPTLTFTPNPASNVVGSTRQVTIQRQAGHARASLTLTMTPADLTMFSVNTNSFVLAADQSTFDVVLTGESIGTSHLAVAAGPYATNLTVIIGQPTIAISPSPITNMVGESRTISFTRQSTEGGAPLPINLVSSVPGIFSMNTNVVIIGANSFTTNATLTGVSVGTGTLQVVVASFTNRIPVTINNPVLTFSPLPVSVTSGQSRAVSLSRTAADTALDVTMVSDDGNVFGVGTNVFDVNYATSLHITFAPYEMSKVIWISGLSFADSVATLSAQAGSYETSTAVIVYGPGDPVVPFNLSVIAGNTVWLYADNLPITTNNWPIRVTYELPEYESRLAVPEAEIQQLVDSKSRYESFVRSVVSGIRRADSIQPNPIPVRMEFFTDPDLGPYYAATTYLTVLDPTFTFLPAAPTLSVGDTIPLTVVRPPLEANASLPFTLTSSDPSVLDISTNMDGNSATGEVALMFMPTVSTNSFHATYYPVYVSARALTQGLTSTVVTVIARVGDYATNIPIRVTRNGLLNLAPVAPTLRAGDTLPMSVSKSGRSNSTPFEVTLISDGPTIATVPATVTIPAEATSVTFNVTGLLPGSTTIRAMGIGCETNANSLRTVTVLSPNLTFSPSPFSNEVGNTRNVYINRPVTEAGADLKIQLAAAASGIVSLPTTNVTIAAGDPGTTVGITGSAAGETTLRAVVGSYSTNLTLVIGAAPDPNDPDHDGLIQEWEEYLGGDPNNAHTFDPILNDGQFDSDGDGLSNLEEINVYGTDPARRDTDNDGVDDRAEVAVDLTNPLHPMSSRIYFEHSLNLGAVPGGLLPPNRSRFYVGTDGITVEGWIRPVSDGDGTIFSIGENGTNSALRVGLENYRPKAVILGGTNVLATAGGIGAAGSIQQLPTNEWTHVAYVWSPSRNSLEIYVNSVLLIAQQTFAAPDFNGGPVTLASGFTSGYLDDLRVWNYDRGWEEIAYWHNRIYPAPFEDYVEPATYGDTLLLYYRFDDAASNLVDFAYLNNTNYFLPGTGSATVTNPAVALIGSDDEDGDLLPEWWTKLNSVERYPITNWGPTLMYFDEDANYLARVAFFKACKTRTSVGGHFCWDDPSDNTNHCPKTALLGWDGRFSAYMKYVYLYRTPDSATLNVYTPGMTNVLAYVNGTLVTAAGQETNTAQSFEIASKLKIGRNMIYVRCVSSYGNYADEARTQQVSEKYAKPHYEGVYGKFDASLICDGTWQILRGDYSKNDPRSVWFAQVWSTYEDMSWDPPLPDLDHRQMPGNQDYGVPDDEDNDGLNAYYELLSRTNPRDSDSDNNGTPDSEEDFDSDGLNNGNEQLRGASPILPDTDDDTLTDGADSGTDNDPASALSPVASRAIILGGSSNDYVEMPMEQRFALDSWTTESWVQRDPADVNGGIAVQRIVGPQGLNYELGLGNGTIAAVNVPYARYASVNGTFVTATGLVAAGTSWTHLAATYDADTGLLKLYINGSLVNTAPVGQPSPAQYSGGSVIQRMGSGLRGQIDEVRIWDRARTATEVSNNYLKTVGGNEANLTAYYRFDDGTSYTNPPLIGTSANNGTNGNLHVLPMTWGQAQDYVVDYSADWWDKWTHAASLHGNTWFTTNGGGAIGSPPSLQVNILPAEVLPQGAQWRVQGVGGWMNSGTTLSDGLEAGSYTILFQDVDGWTKPIDTIVTLSNNVKTILTTNYVQNGGIRVTLGPPAAVLAGAQWRLSGTLYWTNSDVTIGNLTVGGHDIEFKAISGWSEPPVTNLIVSAGATNTYIATYTPVTGAIQIFIEPNAAVTNGAIWRLDGGSARTNSETVIGLALGAHTVSFQDALPWTGPPDLIITLTDSSLVTATGTYSQATGIYVDILPGAAVANGARWRADSGPWLPPGTTYVTAAGAHLVQFNTATNWAPPPDMPVAVTNGYTTFVSANYYAMTVYSAVGTNIIGLLKPSGMAFDPQRILYIADRDHHRIVTIDTKSDYITNFGTYGTSVGQFDQPIGLAIDGRTNLYVADLNNNRIQRRDGSTGTWTAWGTKTEDHSPIGHFNVPYDVALDSLTNLYVADNQNNRIQKKDPAGNWSALVTNGSVQGYTRVPQGIAVDSSNYLYVGDYPYNTGRIQTFGPTSGTFRAVLADSNLTFGVNSNRLLRPRCMTFGPSNMLYVADWYGNSILSRSTNGDWAVLIGSNVLARPEGVLWDNRGFLWIADTDNNRVIRLQVGAVSTNIPVNSWIGPGGGGSIVVYWMGAQYWFYTVQYNDSLMTPFWTNFPNAVNIPGTNGIMSYADTNAVSFPGRSYRVQGY